MLYPARLAPPILTRHKRNCFEATRKTRMATTDHESRPAAFLHFLCAPVDNLPPRIPKPTLPLAQLAPCTRPRDTSMKISRLVPIHNFPPAIFLNCTKNTEL